MSKLNLKLADFELYMAQKSIDRVLKVDGNLAKLKKAQDEIKARLDNCPYCHPPYKEWSGGYWDEAGWQIDRLADGRYELLAIGYPPDSNKLANLPTLIAACPLCGRKLIGPDFDKDDYGPDDLIPM